MIWMAVCFKIILCSSYFIFMFSDFLTPTFSDEVGPYAEFQRSLINWFSPRVRACFSFSLLLHMWYFSVVVTEIV